MSSNLNFDQNVIYFKEILILFIRFVVSYCIGSGYILLEVISKMRLRAHAELPRHNKRDFTSVFMNIKEFIESAQNAHPPQADSASDPLRALMHSLIYYD